MKSQESETLNYLTKQAFLQWLEKHGQKPYRLAQIWRGIGKDLAENWDEITTLSKELRNALNEEILFPKLKVANEKISSDQQVRKVLFDLNDGAQVEAVLLDHYGKRTTVCVSTMIGCPLGCRFCATGSVLGCGRDLLVDEIVGQVLHFSRLFKKENEQDFDDNKTDAKRVTNVVFMGMGEPFLNYENTIGALKWLNDQHALDIAARHLTVSTAGIVPGIKRFAEDGGQICLALSLHAPTQELRASIMPVANKWPLDELMEAIDYYVAKTNRRVFYEYIMLDKVNDSLACARELAKLLKGRLAHVNLIRYNKATLDFRPSAVSQVQRFQEILTNFGVPSTVRASLGGDIDAACGQLKGEHK
ncbi:MAG: 23S rRNA (adenine(2503)-C(2))-methyltransferase RlmN [Patescibacteria group bacterium]|nr:23S rRNA (adenine(2503)-C(2))-methyltransferase RlmN [Patescibacteria group bacterium]